jgi:pyridoxal phosphate enzyme (YggS family)
MLPYPRHVTIPADQIASNARRLHEEIREEAVRLSRSADDITLVAVTKTFGPAIAVAAVECGLTELGENRIQEAKTKIPQVTASQPVRWHLIGHLQTNKAKEAVALFDLIHSVDRIELAQALDHRAGLIGKRQDILVQVNTTAESQKSGCDPSLVSELTGQIAGMPNLRIRGLMTIGPFVDERAPIERAFRLLRREFERLATADLGGGEMRYCSMGMTDDWRIALAEGANMLRIGRAIFGERR